MNKKNNVISKQEIEYIKQNFPSEGGVYQIINLKNNKIYIGSSIDIRKRIRDHLYNLKINSIESGINNITSRLTDAESHISNLSENTYKKSEICKLLNIDYIGKNANYIDNKILEYSKEIGLCSRNDISSSNSSR